MCSSGSRPERGRGRSRPGTRPPRRRPSYAGLWHEHNAPASFRKGERYHFYVRVGNRGARAWPAQHPEGRWVELAVSLAALCIERRGFRMTCAPGEDVLLGIPLTFPLEAEAGAWTLMVSLLEQNVAWFHEQGMAPLVVEVRAEEAEHGPLADANAVAALANGSMWLPTDGITFSRTGRRYPTFIEHAQGCRVRDPDGHEWIDYLMAGGAAVLGYAHPEVQSAIARQLTSSAVSSLPHVLESHVTAMLCDLIPGAEMALFGKHGSDACTVAIRTARLHTGRRTILHSGYHGWHDWYAEEILQPRLKSPSAPRELFGFGLNDTAGFDGLVEQHGDTLAAVILEPAAQARTLDDPPSDADAAFLRHVADVCRARGAVLIFDEIVTGFRHPKGSVQQATGVIPDLTCLGKALSGGMPLAALVGRRDLMQASARCGVHADVPWGSLLARGGRGGADDLPAAMTCPRASRRSAWRSGTPSTRPAWRLGCRRTARRAVPV